MSNIRDTLACELRAQARHNRRGAEDCDNKAASWREFADLLDRIADKCERGELDEKFDDLLKVARNVGSPSYISQSEINRWRELIAAPEGF